MLDLVKLRTFRLAAMTSNFTKAAAQLGYSQSNVTAQIQALEKELGVPLFDRVHQKLVLTEVGRRTLAYADRLLELAHETEASVKQVAEPAGTLRIGATDFLASSYLPALLREFQAHFPHVHVQVARSQRAGADEVMEGSVDLALEAGTVPEQTDLESMVLAKDELVFAASPEYIRLHGEKLPAKRKTRRVLILPQHPAIRSAYEKRQDRRKLGFESVLEIDSTEGAKECAQLGMGIAYLPGASVHKEVESRKLGLYPWKNDVLTSYMVRNTQRWASPALTAFWNTLAAVRFPLPSAAAPR